MDKNMLSSHTLILKLKLQSKFIAKSLNLPEKFGNDLLAKAIYQHFDFNELCDSIIELDSALSFGILSRNQKLKYLLICELEDKEIIDSLHKEIEKMAIRLESRTVINISKIDLISNLYKLFGLENESKYIIDSECIELGWQQYFQTLTDNNAVLFCDLKINDIPTRLIATKISFDEISQDSVKNSLKNNFEQVKGSSIKSNDEKFQIIEHSNWLSDSSQCLSNFEPDIPDNHPVFYKINNQNYLVYGFPLSPHLSLSDSDYCPDINILIKNTDEKQMFILNIESEKLAIEFIFISAAEEEDYCFLTNEQRIQDTLLSRSDTCRFPLVFNRSNYLMVIRPFAHIDWLENSL
jgi:hypothetical protein